jgi:hypothetical protein
MKQKMLILILGFNFFFSSTFAQSYLEGETPNTYSKFYLSYTGGFNLSTMFGSGADEVKSRYESVPKFSGNTALQFGYKPRKWLSIESGAGIIGKGLAYNEPVSGYDAEFKIRYRESFFEFPLIVKPAIIFPDNTIFFGAAGLSYGKQFSANYSVDVSYKDEYGRFDRENISKRNLLIDGVSIPTDTMGGKIIVPYKDLYRMYDVSLVLGIGLEIGGGAVVRSNTFVIELKSLIGLLDQTCVSPNGKRLLSDASEKLTQFMIENHLTAEDLGISNDGEYIPNPIDRYSTFSISIGFKHYF